MSTLVTFIILSTCVWRRWFSTAYQKERRKQILSTYVQDLRDKARLRKQEKLKSQEEAQQLKSEIKEEIEMKARSLKVGFKQEREMKSPKHRRSEDTGEASEEPSPMSKTVDKSINTLHRIDTELEVEYEDMLEKKAQLDMLLRRREEQLQQVDEEMQQKAAALAKAEAAIDKIIDQRQKADSELERVIGDRAEVELELERRRNTISTGPRTHAVEKPPLPARPSAKSC